jgi:hypothetical protein
MGIKKAAPQTAAQIRAELKSPNNDGIPGPVTRGIEKLKQAGFPASGITVSRELKTGKYIVIARSGKDALIDTFDSRGSFEKRAQFLGGKARAVRPDPVDTDPGQDHNFA